MKTQKLLEPNENIVDKVFTDCELIYKQSGYDAVLKHIKKQIKEKNPDYKYVKYSNCKSCGNKMPKLNGICLICGTI